MKRTAALLMAAVLACLAPSAVRADDVVLVGGGTIENVKVTVEGDSYRLSRRQGSSLIPMSDVKRVVYSTTVQDQLAAKKLAAGHDAAALRDVAAWAGSKGLKADKEELIQLARAIELDDKLGALEGTTTAAPYLELARSMQPGEYSTAERNAVLRRGLVLEPDNAQVRLALGEVKRDGRWVTLADARAIDDAREARLMEARGLVKFEGRWVTPEQREQVLTNRAAEREAEAERRAAAAQRQEQERLKAQIARLEQERADQEEAIRQERLAANQQILAERQRALDDMARLQAQRDSLYAQTRWRTRNAATVILDPCTPVYRPRTTTTCAPRPTVVVSRPCPPQPCSPSRPTTTTIVRLPTTPQPQPRPVTRGISPNNPYLNWHPAWNKTGAPPMPKR